jgi:hypothetical protein
MFIQFLPPKLLYNLYYREKYWSLPPGEYVIILEVGEINLKQKPLIGKLP